MTEHSFHMCITCPQQELNPRYQRWMRLLQRLGHQSKYKWTFYTMYLFHAYYQKVLIAMFSRPICKIFKEVIHLSQSIFLKKIKIVFAILGISIIVLSYKIIYFFNLFFQLNFFNAITFSIFKVKCWYLLHPFFVSSASAWHPSNLAFSYN